MKNWQVKIIILISFMVAVSLGLMDKETESLFHLFTAEAGNLVTLFLITVVLSIFGIGVYKLMFSN